MEHTRPPPGAGRARGGDREPRGVAALYLDESVTHSILSGLIVLLGALWSLWGAFWLRRVELVRENQDVVRRLGLCWGREGFGPSVRAAGRVAGAPVRVVWRRAVFGGRVRAWRGEVEGGPELLDQLLAEVSADRSG